MSRLQLAWSQLRTQLPQVASALFVIALGVGLAAAMLLADSALESTLVESLDAIAGNADLHIAPRAGGTVDLDLVDELHSIPGVRAAAPLLVATGFAEGATPARVRIIGVDMLDDSTVRLYNSVPTESAGIEDPLLFLSQPDSAILPASLIASLNLRVGARLRVQTPVGWKEVTVRGVLEDSGVGRAFAGGFLVMDLEAAQRLVGSRGRVSQIDVVIDPNVPVASVQATIEARLPPYLMATSAQHLREKMARTISGFRAVIAAGSMMGLLLAAIITANRLTTIYQERMWEMAILRGMGWTPTALVFDLLAEAALLSVFATLVGLPVGVLFAKVMIAPIRDAAALGLQQALTLPSIELHPWPLGIAATAGIASGIAAALVPALRASTASIALLSAKRRRRDPRPTSPRKRALTIALASLGTFSFLLHAAIGSRPAAASSAIFLMLACALLVQPGLQVAAKALSTILGGAAAAGVSDQSRAPSRAIGATAVLLAGTTLIIWIQSTAGSFERYAVDTNAQIRGADLIVDSAFDDQPTAGFQPRFEDTIVRRIAALPGVIAVGADSEAVVLQPSLGLMAVDANRLLDSRLGPWASSADISTAALREVAAGTGALADSTVFRRMEIEIGDTINIMTPSGPIALRIVGVTPTAFISAQGDLVIGRSLYRQYWADETVNRIYVAIDPGFDAESVRAGILEGLGQEYGLRVRQIGEFSSWIASNVRQGFTFLKVLTAITISVVVVGTADALAANVTERTREIGTLRALGYGPSAVARMILAQALAIGLAGCALAVVLGLALSVVFVEGVLEPAVGWDLTPVPSYGTAVWATLVGISSCVLGSLVPALRASRIPIATALRYE